MTEAGKKVVVRVRRDELRDMLEKVASGEVDFDAFLRATSKHWDRLAHFVERVWDLPSWFDGEDLRQEIRIAAWRAVVRFDPSRGSTIKQSVVFCSVKGATKAAERAHNGGQRRHRGHDKRRGLVELPFTRIAATDERSGGGEEAGSRGEPMLAWKGQLVAPVDERAIDPGEEIDRGRAYERARRACGSIREVLSVQAVERSRGSLDGAAALLYDDPEARRLCRLGSEDVAKRVVKRAVMDVAKRVEHIGAAY